MSNQPSSVPGGGERYISADWPQVQQENDHWERNSNGIIRQAFSMGSVLCCAETFDWLGLNKLLLKECGLFHLSYWEPCFPSFYFLLQHPLAVSYP